MGIYVSIIRFRSLVEYGLFLDNKLQLSKRAGLNMENILIFMSDQHRSDLMKCMGNDDIDTPNLDKLSEDGTTYSNAYTSSPLCVPARMSFLTGKLPSKLNIFGNDDALPEEQLTFLHSLAVQGYETVLCGRMHFKGENQFHGFTKRIAPDITPQYWGTGGTQRTDLGDFKGTFTEKGCLKVIGSGNSPVLDYDRMVVETVLDYLNKDHDKPQCIVVGTYAPHFTYMTTDELYDKYKERLKNKFISMPNSSGIPELVKLERDFDLETYINTNAAYYGMVEEVDELVGRVRNAWNEYLKRNDRSGSFFYISDHGDHVGDRKLFGKKTFFDCSVKIPVLAAGNKFPINNKAACPVSIMDIAPTVIEMTNSPQLPNIDGQSLLELSSHNNKISRVVLSEMMLAGNGELTLGRMAANAEYKFFKYSESENEYLFNNECSQRETINLVDEIHEKHITDEFRTAINDNFDFDETIRAYRQRIQGLPLLKLFGQKTEPYEKYRYTIPESIRCIDKSKYNVT